MKQNKITPNRHSLQMETFMFWNEEHWKVCVTDQEDLK